MTPNKWNVALYLLDVETGNITVLFPLQTSGKQIRCCRCQILCLCPGVHCLIIHPCLHFCMILFHNVCLCDCPHIVASFSTWHISTSGWSHNWSGSAPSQRRQAPRGDQPAPSVWRLPLQGCQQWRLCLSQQSPAPSQHQLLLLFSSHTQIAQNT